MAKMLTNNEDMRAVKYVCSKCQATDTPRFFPDEHVMPVINCWKCHAGFKLEISQQIQRNIGMFPEHA